MEIVSADFAVLRTEGIGLDELAQFFGALRRCERRFWQDCAELFSAVTTEPVVRAQTFLQVDGDAAQHRVTGEMTVAYR